MSVSSYYEIVPQTWLDSLINDPDLISVFCSMWGYGSGMYFWFNEIEELELEDIVSEHSKTTVNTLRELLSSMESFSSAYIEKTHKAHITMLSSEFAAAGASNPEEFARIVVDGYEEWGHGTDLAITNPQHCTSMAVLMKDFVVADILDEHSSKFPAPTESWQRQSLTWHLQDLKQELQGLIDCYCLAARMNHPVLTGFS